MALEGKTLALAVGALALGTIGAGTLLLYAGQPAPAPPRPQAPPPPEVLMNSVLKYSQPVWRALVETDAARYKVPVPSLADMGKPNPYFVELSTRRKLRVRDSMATAHLRLALEISKRKATLEGQSYAVDHLVLRIQNRTPKYLAYRLQTHITDERRCASKGHLPHNALVIGPEQTVLRSECLYRRDESLEVVRVEVMELSPLGAYYVSRLPTIHALYDPRTAAGHVAMADEVCPQTFSWREIQEGIDRQEFGWRDVIDFYSRHNCDEFSFFRTYRYRTDPSGPLPARPLD